MGAIFLSIFDWWNSSHGHSDIQLARTISGRRPVLFVNSIGMRLPSRRNSTAPWQRVARKVRSMARRSVQVDPKLRVTTPVALPVYQGLAERVNRSVVTRQIRGQVARLRIVDPTIFITVPTYANVALALPRRSLVYLRSDLHSAYPGADQAMLRRYEDILFERADVVAYSNRRLFEREAPALGGRARYIGHGIDRARFSPAGEQDPEIARLPRPLVGFFGELRERSVDFDLIAEVARRLPDVSFVLGGSRLEDPAALRGLPNVHIVEACPHERMPARWRSVDVAMLPYKRSAWLDVSEPIKLGEILATGLKGVGTPLASLCDHPGQILTAADAASFAEAIRSQLARGAATPGGTGGDLRGWDEIASELLPERGVA